MIHGVIDPTLILRIKILFQLVSTQSQLITTSIRFQGSTILRLWNPRSNGAALFHKKLETTARSSHLFEIFGRLALYDYGTGPIRLRSHDDWPRSPGLSCLYALQIGAQSQRPYFPPFLVHPGWQSKKARKLSSHALVSCSSFPSLGCD